MDEQRHAIHAYLVHIVQEVYIFVHILNHAEWSSQSCWFKKSAFPPRRAAQEAGAIPPAWLAQVALCRI